jgi:hypothetical protein
MRQAQAGFDADFSRNEPAYLGAELTLSMEPATSSVLAKIAESVGGIPIVLLRDTDLETGPGPILKPSAPEVLEPGERPDKDQFFGEIARGGRSAVLRGRDVDLGRGLAGIRDRDELAKLPEDEQAACRALDQAHGALGYEETDRLVFFKKDLD